MWGVMKITSGRMSLKAFHSRHGKAFHICKCQDGLTANVKLHFFFNSKLVPFSSLSITRSHRGIIWLMQTIMSFWT